MVLPIAWGILGLLGLIACSKKQKSDEECWRQGPNGQEPCTPVVVREPEKPIDTDGDRIPDDQDRCPSQPHIGSMDGCPPPAFVVKPEEPPPNCGEDSDGDGINNCEDRCPNLFGVAETQGCSETTYPLTRDYYRLVSLQGESHIFAQPTPCVHFTQNSLRSSILLWSDGGKLTLRHLQPLRDIVLYQREENVSDINLCPLRRAIAVDREERYAILWNEGSAGGESHLYFQRWNREGVPIGEPQWVDSFPMPNLGPLADHKIASLALKPDGRAIVVWTNRDKVLFQSFPMEGDPTPARFVNQRDIHIPRVINSDVTVDEAGNIALAWQKGSETTGPLGLVVIENEGEILHRLDWNFLNEPSRMPAVAFTGGLLALAWERSDISLSVVKQEGENYQLAWSGTIARQTPELPELRNPSVTLDPQGRFLMSWAARANGAQSYKVFLKEAPNYQILGSANFTTGFVLDEAVFSAWTYLSGPPLVSSATILYPSQNEETWRLETFEWEGSVAPILGPSIRAEPSSIVLRGGRGILRIENEGSLPLDLSWELSAGFFIVRSQGRLSWGNDRLAPLTGKVYLIRSDLRAGEGTWTLETNDPQRQRLTLPIRVE